MDLLDIISNILYALCICIIVTITFCLLLNKDALTSKFTFPTFIKTLPNEKNINEIINTNKKLLASALNNFTIELDDDGNVTNSIIEICQLLSYHLGLNTFDQNTPQFQKVFVDAAKKDERMTYDAFEHLIPNIIYKLQFLKTSMYWDSYKNIINAMLQSIKQDKNANAPSKIYYYILKYEINSLDIDSDDLMIFTNGVNELQKTKVGTINDDMFIKNFYTHGNVPGLEHSLICRTSVLLFIMTLYRGKFGNPKFDNILEIFKLIKPTIQNSLFVNSAQYDPNRCINEQSNSMAIINAAIILHTLYDANLFSANELLTMLNNQSFNEPSDLYDVECLIIEKIPFNENIPSKKQLFFNNDINYAVLSFVDFKLSIAPNQNYFDFWSKNALATNALAVKDENIEWKNENNLVLFDNYKNYIYGISKNNTNFRQNGTQAYYFVANENSLSVLNLFSDLSFSVDSKLSCHILNLYSIFEPIIYGAKESIVKQEPTKDNDNIEFHVDANKVISIEINTDSNKKQMYHIWCNCNLIITIQYNKNIELFLLTINILNNLQSITLNNQSSTYTYKYYTFSIMNQCENFPEKLPELKIKPFGPEKNVLRYNDYLGINKLNLYSHILNEHLFTNLSISPSISNESRSNLLIADYCKMYGKIVFPKNSDILSINNKTAEYNNYIGYCSNIITRIDNNG